MAGIFQRLDTMNQTFRTGLMLAVTAGVGYGGYVGYDRFVKPAMELETMRDERDRLSDELEQVRGVVSVQKQQIGQLEKDKDRLTTSLRLIKLDRRLAYLTVLALQPASEGKAETMTVMFTEVDAQGKRVDTPRIFQLDGHLLSVDCWLAKFDDKYIETADLARGATLCIIRGIKGAPGSEFQPIDAGVPYLPNGDLAADPRPAVYRTQGQLSELEKQVWGDFWNVANDPDKQKELGIRANHGQVNYIEVQEVGAVYQLDLRASDGGTIRKIDNPPAVALPEPDAA